MSVERARGPEEQTAQVWLRYAHEDLQTARRIQVSDADPPRHACSLAQQAAEKGIKALLMVLKIKFPLTHDLDMLRTLVPPAFATKTSPADVSRLSFWAAKSRYPGPWPEPDAAEGQRAVEASAAVLQAVRDDLASLGWPDHPPD